MSTGPLSFIGSAAGSPLAQAKGSEVTRTQHEAANQARQTDANRHAEDAAGIGQADHDEQAGDRDADGRRIWEIGPDGKRRRQPPPAESVAETLRQAKDPTGQSGGQIDLSG